MINFETNLIVRPALLDGESWQKVIELSDALETTGENFLRELINAAHETYLKDKENKKNG